MTEVKLKRLPHAPESLPEYQSAEAAGFDIQSTISICVHAGTSVIIPSGFEIELEPGYEAQVRSRSGLASKGIVVGNSPGTIDSDYRGEIKIIISNITKFPYTISKGDRIAQIVIAPVIQAAITEVNSLNETVRGSGGFGSTGN